MDKAGDVKRRPFNSKRSPNFSSAELAGRDGSAPEKTRKEKFQSLSLVGRANSSFPDGEKSMGPSDASDREEELRTVVGRKRFKLPRKFLEDCNSVKQAPIPRKLRSAMKKRSRESVSPPMSDGKKPKHSIRGSESPKKDGAKKTKKKGRSEPDLSGPITKDEEEVVETLYALAGMFLNNNDTCNPSRADEESPRPDISAVRGGTETSTSAVACEARQEDIKLSVPSCTGERSSQETRKTSCPDRPRTCELPEILDRKLFGKEEDSRVEIDLQPTPPHSLSEKSNNELCASWNIGLAAEPSCDARLNQPEKIDILLPPRKKECKEVELSHKMENRQNSGPVLWPGLFNASVSRDVCGPSHSSASKVPAWPGGAGCSTRPRAVESRSLIEKVPCSRAYEISRKKCGKHVFICHLIQTLQMPVSKDRLPFQPKPGRQHKETEQRIGPRFSTLENGSCQAFASTMVPDSQRNPSEARNTNLQQNRRSQGPKSSLSEFQGFDFLSLSTSVSSPDQKPDVHYLHSIPKQQHMSVPLSTSKTYYSHAYADRFSGVTPSHQVQLQLPSYLGNSDRSLLHQGPVIIPKEQQHQQMLWAGPISSAQYKPTGSLKAAAQYPTWHNGRMGSCAMVPFAAVFPPPPPPSTVDILGAKHSQLLSQQHLLHHHHQQQQQQQQQLTSAPPSFPPVIHKRQGNLALEETLPRFHGGGGAFPSQLLCNERL